LGETLVLPEVLRAIFEFLSCCCIIAGYMYPGWTWLNEEGGGYETLELYMGCSYGGRGWPLF